MFRNAADRQAVSGEAGFSLVESVVALGVFSLVVMTTLTLVNQNASSAVRLEVRTKAAFVAENVMVETRLSDVINTSDTSGIVEMGGHEFEWQRFVSDTEEADLKRVIIRVRQNGKRQVLAEINGFWHG